MKKSKILLLVISLFFNILSFAQRQTYISINGNSSTIENLLMQDSLAAGRTYYTATFTFSLNNDPALLNILNALKKGGATVSFLYTRSSTGITERQYLAATVLLADFSKLNAVASRETLKMEVSIRTSQVIEKVNTGFKYKPTQAKVILAPNFLIKFDNLPTNRVVTVTDLQLKNNSLLRLEIAAADLDSWAKWMRSPGKRINGSIALLAPNMTDQLMLVKLSNIEIVGLTQNIIVADERLERFTVLLRVGDIAISEK